jgi:hypothetical protein
LTCLNVRKHVPVSVHMRNKKSFLFFIRAQAHGHFTSMAGGMWWRKAGAPPQPPNPTSVSNTQFGFLLDPTVEQLLLALYQEITSSAGHFFVEVYPYCRLQTYLPTHPPMKKCARTSSYPPFLANQLT